MIKSSQQSPFIKQCFITATVDLTTVCFGSTLGFPAILLPQLRDPLSPIKLSKEAESWIGSVYALGMLFGYFLTPPIMDRLGRKRAHYFVAVLFIIGWFTAVLAADAKVLILCRILQGTAGGLISPLATIFLGECSSPKNRGAFLTTITLSQSTGILLVHTLGAIVSWRTTALICVFFPFVSLIMSIYTPESPSWLLSRGRYDKFEKVFRWFRGDIEEEELRSMMRAKLNAEKMEAEEVVTSTNYFGNLKDEIIKKEFYKPIIIMIHSNNLLQFAGGTLMITYSTFIVSIVMGPGANIYMWTVFMDAWRLFANVIAIFVIHNFKRRTMIFSSGGLCVFAFIALICYLYGTSENWFQKSSWIPVVFLSLQLFSNAVGIVPLRYVIAGEIFPLRYRGISGSISSASGSIFMFIVLKTFPALVDKFYLYGAYILYGCIISYNLLVLWIMLPETKGRTLLQIEEDFKGIKPVELTPTEINIK